MKPVFLGCKHFLKMICLCSFTWRTFAFRGRESMVGLLYWNFLEYQLHCVHHLITSLNYLPKWILLASFYTCGDRGLEDLPKPLNQDSSSIGFKPSTLGHECHWLSTAASLLSTANEKLALTDCQVGCIAVFGALKWTYVSDLFTKTCTSAA